MMEQPCHSTNEETIIVQTNHEVDVYDLSILDYCIHWGIVSKHDYIVFVNTSTNLLFNSYDIFTLSYQRISSLYRIDSLSKR